MAFLRQRGSSLLRLLRTPCRNYSQCLNHFVLARRANVWLFHADTICPRSLVRWLAEVIKYQWQHIYEDRHIFFEYTTKTVHVPLRELLPLGLLPCGCYFCKLFIFKSNPGGVLKVLKCLLSGSGLVIFLFLAVVAQPGQCSTSTIKLSLI